MILLRILDHDLHKYKRGVDGTIFWIEVPAKPSFLPAVVSLSTPKFSVARKLVDGMIRSGVFKYDSDRLDEIIPDLMNAAYELSLSEKWDNIHKTSESAFNWLQKQSGTEAQPHCVLVPLSWSQKELEKWAGKSNLTHGSTPSNSDGTRDTVSVYKKTCRIQQCGVKFPIFLSRPDFVGMYTQILGGKSSIVLHNIKHSIAFCPRK